MEKVIISGISGFVGTNLRNYLDNKVAITVYNRNDIDCEFNGHSCFIHLAGKAHDLKKNSDYQDYHNSNFELTKNIFERFINSDVNKLIFISSVKAVADSFNGILTEEETPDPKTDYGKSKLLAEEYILSRNLPQDKQVFILRPCMIHGPGNKGNLNLLYKIVSKRIPWPLGAFENKRSFCSIGNLLFVIKELINRSDIPSGVYNIADDEPISTNELIRLIAISNHKSPLIWYFPKYFIKLFTRIGDVLGLPINSESLVKLTESYIVSNNKIKNVLVKPMPISTRDGIIQTFQSFKNND